MPPVLPDDPQPTEELFQQYVLPTYSRFSLCLARGKGSHVWDEAGQEYLDFGAGIAVCSVGHSHPRVVAAISRQAAVLSHTSNLYYSRPQGLLAKKLVELVGSAGRCFFCNSGAEANEALYKLARRFGNLTKPGGRFEVITFQRSFHGRTLAGLAATGQEKVRHGFEPLTPGFVQAIFNGLKSVEAMINERTAAVLLEPIQGESGVLPARAEFLRGLRKLCDERGVLLMFDEIQCGLGRTGDWCGWRSLGAPEVLPDAISWAKGMAGGFPMGAIWVRDRPIAMMDGAEGSLGDLYGPGTHGTTFGGNPLGCMASLETFQIIEDENLLANAAAMGRLAKTSVTEIQSPWIEEVRGTGLMIGLVLRAEAFSSHPGTRNNSRSPAMLMVDRLQYAGLLAVPAGTHIVRWLPPLNVSRTEVERAVSILKNVLESLA